MEERIKETAKLELRAVHPNSRTEAPRVKNGETLIPGYTYFEYKFKNEEGEDLTEEQLPWSRRTWTLNGVPAEWRSAIKGRR